MVDRGLQDLGQSFLLHGVRGAAVAGGRLVLELSTRTAVDPPRLKAALPLLPAAAWNSKREFGTTSQAAAWPRTMGPAR